MDDEIREFAEGRPDVPPYGAEARARARERLLAEARHGRRFRLPRLGWQAAAAFGVTVVLVGGVAVALSNQGPGGPATSVVQAVEMPKGELNPRPGQFIVVESETMYTSQSFADGKETRYLYRTHRKIWQSTDGSANGLLMSESLEPRPWPGEALPEEAKAPLDGPSYMGLPSCPEKFGERRTDYAYLSTLPTDAAALRERLYRLSARPQEAGKAADRDVEAFGQGRDLLLETYLPRAQREALFEAIKGIPGVETADGVKDSAGRAGTALQRLDHGGVRTQLIFDPATYLYMGERQVVVDAAEAKAPEGSVLAWTAQLGVAVVDRLPDVEASTEGDVTCTQPQPLESLAPMPPSAVPTESAAPVASPAAPTESAPAAVPTESASPVASPAESAPPAKPGESASPVPKETAPSAVPETRAADRPTEGPSPVATR
ncbi:unnamed protein product [[Actinomadura] parvosata subsp. kistnae]|uniref:CU044_5270 family protein n=1 Tax=[Actinomadura] parvosata subsp. kistnae TaxID=1909395 RepID=A0A1V0A5Y9_9ACTN|nr:CU044_5270 family protein [Nonomuraea sp. ATCC 55076]AQZ65626.1 hypothetical protein BKM31_32935 [Nonomuraea sp. ATCC 55076]SPL97008.1 unnamed protein product [Actinomadura parvosata subsp. kistnae]